MAIMTSTENEIKLNVTDLNNEMELISNQLRVPKITILSFAKNLNVEWSNNRNQAIICCFGLQNRQHTTNS